MIRTLLEIIAEITGKEKGSLFTLITFVKDRPAHDRRYAIDFAKIKADFSWKPASLFHQSLSDTVVWYLENRPWWERIITGAYLEYCRLKYGKRVAE